jgi:membrane protein implicated in regulation of membrane protease activity
MWWILIVLGILLMILEVITPGFIVMWFGIALIVAAIPVYFQAPTEIVLATFAATLLLLTVFVRRIFISRFVHKSGVRTNVASVIGEQGVVIETIDKVKSTGKVRVNKEVWTAKAEHDEVIPLDQIVTVVRVDGVKLIIRKG